MRAVAVYCAGMSHPATSASADDRDSGTFQKIPAWHRLWDSVADMAILLAATLALLPLILAPHVLFYWDITPKIVVLLVGTAIALPLAWRERRAHSPALRILGWLLVAQAVSLAISTAFSIDPALSLGG